MSKSLNPERPLFQTCAGLAEEMGVSPSTLRRWEECAAIPERVEVVPGVHRFYMPDVYEAINAMRDRSKQAPVKAAGKMGKRTFCPKGGKESK